MSEKEYIVTLTVDADPSSFQADMTQNSGDSSIPSRSVDIANPRPGSVRNTHYSLTAEEAEALKNDNRVLDVEVPPDDIPDSGMELYAVQSGDFTKTSSSSGSHLPWAIHRCSRTTNDYGAGTTVSGDYEYNLDGTGVDIVIQDSGIQADHPDFNDADGNSRVTSINWATESGLSFTQSVNHDRDYHGHGTHCAGTAASLTYGWAKNARIYSQKLSGLEGNGDSGTGISATYAFDAIKIWHQNKPVDPATGYKRPTIVNMSWGYYVDNSFEPYDGYYRGTQWTYDNNNTGVANSFSTSTLMQQRTGLPLWNAYTSDFVRRTNPRYTSVDTDVEELIAAGVHVCIAAGNRNLPIDVNGGPDYNNRYRVNPFGTPGGYIYYCRGSSPFSTNAFMVGSVDDVVNSTGNLEQRASYSNSGPGVDIYAPGDNIISTMSTTNEGADGDYPNDANFKIGSKSGTSMASPQVCGIGALVLQVNPHMTPAQLKTFLHNQAQSGKLREDPNYSTWTTANSNYTSSTSTGRYLQGAPDRYLYSPFPGQYKFRIQNSQQFTAKYM